MALRFVIIGGGPAGNTAATHAARLGAEVTIVERDVIGGAAHLWDCIPSKAMIATGGAMSFNQRIGGMGLTESASHIDLDLVKLRIGEITDKLQRGIVDLLSSQGVRMLHGTGRLKGPNEVEVETTDGVESLEADAVLISTGSRPRVPDWATVDHQCVLTTRDAYPPPELPSHLVVIGSGVTGVEFVHMFSSFGSEVTLVVSRQQVLPSKDAEVAAALEDEFLRRGVRLLKGARAVAIEQPDGWWCRRAVRRRSPRRRLARAARHRVDSELRGPRARRRRCRGRRGRLHPDQSPLPVERAARVRRGRRVGQAAVVVGGRDAGPQDRRARDGSAHAEAHRHLDYDKAASAIFTEPEIADVGWPRPTRSPPAARCARRRCRSRRRRRR